MSKSSSKPLVIIGGGGHASVLVDILRTQQRDIIAVVSPSDPGSRTVFQGLTHFYHDDDVFQFSADEVLLVNGIGSLPNSTLKQKLNQYYLSQGYQFETVIADSAQISPYAHVEPGSQIFPGAIIQAGVKIGSHTIINTGAIIEHDCSIGKYSHIAPSAIFCGQVKAAENVYVGASATVIQNIKLEKNVVVGAGAVVTKDLFENEICYPSRAVVKSRDKLQK